VRRLLTLALPLLLLAPRAFCEELSKLRAALVRVDAARQPWDDNAPWQKEAVQRKSGQGVVVAPGMVLTLARLVADAQLVEVSVENSARRYLAQVKHVDPAVGLALVEITDETLRAQVAPLPIGDPARLDDEFDLYQLGESNLLQRYSGRVVSASAEGPRLVLRLSSTLPASGDGQAAVRGGRLLGVVSGIGKSQEATLLSVETIRRYVDDLADGAYAGPPGPGPWTQPLLRDDLRAFLRLSPSRHGVAISRTVRGATGDQVFRENDVLLSIDGYDLDDEGRFTHDVHGRLDADYLFEGRRSAGETVKARVLRDGQTVDAELELRPRAAAATLVPDRGPDRPQFLVVGGLVIRELTRDFAIDRRAPGATVLRRHVERAGWDQAPDRKRVVFVDQVLADVSNRGFETFGYAIVESVNGMKIRGIADVARALDAPQDGYHVFRFEGTHSDFVIPAVKLEEIDRRIANAYRVSRLRYLDGDPE
jgi:S1-C subfamily serine protease